MPGTIIRQTRVRYSAFGRSSALLTAAVVELIPFASAYGTDRVKADNGLDLNLGASWVNGTAPNGAELAIWDHTVTGSNATILGANLNWWGIRITDPGGDVAINDDGHSLSLGNGGIDMSTATKNLTINPALSLSTNETWNVNTALTINGDVSFSSGASTLSVLSGAVTINGNVSFNASTQAWNTTGVLMVNGNISFPSRFTKSGSGTLVLGGANRFPVSQLVNGNVIEPAGSLTLGGTLKVASSSALNSIHEDVVLNSTTSTLDLAGYNSSIWGLSGTGQVTNSSLTPSTLSLSPAVGGPSFAGIISDGIGPVNLLVKGRSPIYLSGHNTYSGTTTVLLGGIELNFFYDGDASNILPTNTTLVMAGGLLMQDNASSGGAMQTIGSMVVGPGASEIRQSASANVILNLGNITRPSGGGTMAFSFSQIPSNMFLPSISSTTNIFTTASLTSSGILGGWAYMYYNGDNGSFLDWVTRDTTSANSSIHALAADQHSSAFGPGINTDLTANLTAGLNTSTGSVRFPGAHTTLTLNGANVIESGGILVKTAGVITGSSPTDTLTSGNGSDLIAIIDSHLVMNNSLMLDVIVANNGSIPIALTESGGGAGASLATLTLTRVNTYTGGTFVNGGTLLVQPGADVGSGPIAINMNTSATNSMAKLEFAANGGTHSIIDTITGNGTLQTDSNTTLISNGLTLGQLIVNGTHNIRAGESNAGTVKVNTLTVANSGGVYSGKLDLNDNRLIIQYDPTLLSTSITKTTVISGLKAALAAGSSGGTWTGNGITSSTAAADPTHYGVGIWDNAVPAVSLTSFGGQSVDSNSILVSIAHIGDADGNGIVNIIDLSIVANAWQQPGNNWAAGDLNGDGIVNIIDFTMVANNWQQSSAFGLEAQASKFGDGVSGLEGAAGVPETGTVGLLALGGMILARRRRREI